MKSHRNTSIIYTEIRTVADLRAVVADIDAKEVDDHSPVSLQTVTSSRAGGRIVVQPMDDPAPRSTSDGVATSAVSPPLASNMFAILGRACICADPGPTARLRMIDPACPWSAHHRGRSDHKGRAWIAEVPKPLIQRPPIG